MSSLIAPRKLSILLKKATTTTTLKLKLSVSQNWKHYLQKDLTGVYITSQHELEVLFKRTPYADTFRYIQNFKPKQVHFQDIF